MMRDAFEMLYIGTSIFACLSLIAWVYTAYAKKNEILKNLSNCHILRGYCRFSAGGVVEHLLMMGVVTSVLFSSKMHIRRGGADIKDINSFPKKLRVRIAAQYYSMCGLFFFVFVLSMLDDYIA
jgi:hypothetical protein